MQTRNGASWSCVFGSTPPGGVYCIFRDVVNCAGGCVGTDVFFFRRFSAQAPASQIPLGPAFPVSVISTMARVHKVRGSSSVRPAAHLGGAHDATDSRDGYTSLFWMGFRALGIATCGRFSSLADDLPALRDTVRYIESKQASWWRFGNRQKLGREARAHGMPVELPASSWENLMKAFQDQYGSSIPLKELPAQSYFEVLEEMVHDRVFYAESTCPGGRETLRTSIGWPTRNSLTAYRNAFRWLYHSSEAASCLIDARRS